MPREHLASIYALVDDPSNPVRRIALAQPVQRELSDLFAAGAASLIGATVHHVPFDGRYRADDGEVLVVEGFAVPTEIGAALRNPAECEPLRLSDAEAPSIKAIVCGRADPDAPVVFQVFERRQLLAHRGISLVLSSDTYKKLEDPGLIVAEGATACCADGRVYFRSFSQARRILDLSAHYREATNADILDLASLESVYVADPQVFVREADGWIRRKVALVCDSRVLETYPAREIAKRAAGFGLQVNLRADGQSEQLVFPNSKRELKELLRFLDEDYFEAPLTGTKFATNSKRRIATVR